MALADDQIVKQLQQEIKELRNEIKELRSNTGTVNTKVQPVQQTNHKNKQVRIGYRRNGYIKFCGKRQDSI